MTPRLAPLRAFVEDYASDTGGRVVVVNGRGRALVDTDPPEAGARDFSSRPEFREALAGRVATGVSHSELLGTDLLYVAVPSRRTGGSPAPCGSRIRRPRSTSASGAIG